MLGLESSRGSAGLKHPRRFLQSHVLSLFHMASFSKCNPIFQSLCMCLLSLAEQFNLFTCWFVSKTTKAKTPGLLKAQSWNWSSIISNTFYRLKWVLESVQMHCGICTKVESGRQDSLEAIFQDQQKFKGLKKSLVSAECSILYVLERAECKFTFTFMSNRYEFKKKRGTRYVLSSQNISVALAFSLAKSKVDQIPPSIIHIIADDSFANVLPGHTLSPFLCFWQQFPHCPFSFADALKALQTSTQLFSFQTNAIYIRSLLWQGPASRY